MSAPGTTGPRPKNRRDLILQAAAELFGSRGFHDVGIDEIGDAVGTTGPAIYRHFDSKESIVMAAIERTLGRMSAAVDALEPGPDGGPPPVDRVLEVVVQAELDEWDFATVWRRERRGLPAARLAEVQPRRRRIIGTLGASTRAAVGPVARHDLLLRMTAQHGLVTGVLLHGPRATGQRHARLLTDLATRALTVPLPPLGDRQPALLADAAPARRSRREVILDAAVRLFAERGYRAVGIDDMGALAGITGPSVYRHFDSKDALLVEAVGRCGDAIAGWTTAALGTTAAPPQALVALTDALLTLLHGSPELVVVAFDESHHLRGAPRQRWDQQLACFVDEWVALLRAARPDLDDGSARCTALALVGMCTGVAAEPELRQHDLRPPLAALLAHLQR